MLLGAAPSANSKLQTVPMSLCACTIWFSQHESDRGSGCATSCCNCNISSRIHDHHVHHRHQQKHRKSSNSRSSSCGGGGGSSSAAVKVTVATPFAYAFGSASASPPTSATPAPTARAPRLPAPVPGSNIMVMVQHQRICQLQLPRLPSGSSEGCPKLTLLLLLLLLLLVSTCDHKSKFATQHPCQTKDHRSFRTGCGNSGSFVASLLYMSTYRCILGLNYGSYSQAKEQLHKLTMTAATLQLVELNSRSGKFVARDFNSAVASQVSLRLGKLPENWGLLCTLKMWIIILSPAYMLPMLTQGSISVRASHAKHKFQKLRRLEGV